MAGIPIKGSPSTPSPPSRPSTPTLYSNSPLQSPPIPQIPSQNTATATASSSPRSTAPYLLPGGVERPRTGSNTYSRDGLPSNASSSNAGTREFHVEHGRSVLSELTIPSHFSPAIPSTAELTALSDAQKAAIVRAHLLNAQDQQSAAQDQQQQSSSSSTSAQLSSSRPPVPSSPRSNSPWVLEEQDEDFPTPYNLQGGDIVAPIYKWAAQQAGSESTGNGGNGNEGGLRRSRSMLSLPENASAFSGRRIVSSGSELNGSQFELGGAGGSDNGDGEGEEDSLNSEMRVREILEPGGFRRDFVIRKMNSRHEVGVSGFGGNGTTSSFNNSGRGNGNGRFTRSFIDFLSLYGHFGGEDLEDLEEEDEEDESEDLDEEDQLDYNRTPTSRIRQQHIEATDSETRNPFSSSNHSVSERTPLFSGKSTLRSRGRNQEVSDGTTGTSNRKRSSSVGQHGDATVTQAVLMLLKSFVGTGVLFLGKAFYNGGMLFSTIVLCFIAMISLYSFLLLVQTRLVVHGSFGDIGGILYGKYMRWMILFSIVMSQIGFVAAYTIFVAQNLQAFFMAVTKCRTYIPIVYLILTQLVIFLPLAMIRNIQKLSGTALIADAFILFGLVYIFSNEIAVLADNGLADVKWFNAQDFPLLIGTAVFSFEGIGLVIPITESMKDPHQFPRVLTGVMLGVMFLFAGAGVLAYAAYGSAIQTVVFVNLPQDDVFVNIAQFLYSLAILLSTPLQLFPAVRIMENGIFSRSGKHSDKVKWEKNLFRSAVVVGCSLVAWLGASDLDKFVSLIGSVACVPLCFIYPALLHYKACAVTRKQKAADIALFFFGCLAAVYTTSQTIKLLASGESGAPPTFGNCPPHG